MPEVTIRLLTEKLPRLARSTMGFGSPETTIGRWTLTHALGPDDAASIRWAISCPLLR